MKLGIRHTTRYHYSDEVKYGLQRLRLQPKHTNGQNVIDWRMHLDGATVEVEYDDQHNNHTTLVTIDQGTRDLIITCEGLVETAENNGVIGSHSGYLPLWHFCRKTRLTTPGPELRHVSAELAPVAGKELEFLHDLCNRVGELVRYEVGKTDVETTAEQALASGFGVCQDQAHVFIALSRMAGFPARYVSGYLMMKDRVEQEAGHAWAEVFVQGLGWVGFDIANAISPDPHYVRVASGLDYRDAAPITGICYGSGQTELEVSLAVEQQVAEQ